MRYLKPNTFKLSLLLSSVATAAVAAGCGGDAETITCGKGTHQEGSTCVIDEREVGGEGGSGGSKPVNQGGDPNPMTAGTGGSGGSAGEPSGPMLPEFAGVTALAPASDTSLLVVWNPARYGDVAAANFTYEVHVATKKGAQNFKVPTLVTPPGASSALVTGLEADTSYFVVVRAVAPDGTKDENVSEAEGAPAEDSEAPSFDGAADAEAAGPTSVKLSWDAGEDDLTPPEALVYVAYLAEGGPGSEDFAGPPVAISEPGATELVVTGLDAAETEYHFVVRARDAAGNSDDNLEEIDGATGPDTTAPLFGGCSLATATGATSVFVSWKPARDDVTQPADVQYAVYVADTTGEQDFTLPAAEVTGKDGVDVPDLNPSTTYYFVCRASDASANRDENTSERLARTGDDGTPPVFAGVDGAVKNVTAKSVELTWTAATDDKSTPEQIVYDVFQSTSSGNQNFEMPIATSDPGATSIVLQGLLANQNLFWVVRARDKAGNLSDNLQEATAKTLISFKQSIQQGIFNVHCALSGCHTGLSPTGDMDLSEGFGQNAYDDILNVPSQGKPAIVRIKPNSVDESYLYMKITGAAGIFGTVMPPASSGDTLSAQDIQTIADWIDEGAQNN
jgi:hypothetical protein